MRAMLRPGLMTDVASKDRVLKDRGYAGNLNLIL